MLLSEVITTAAPKGRKRRAEDTTDAIQEPNEPSKRPQRSQIVKTAHTNGADDDFHLTHQEVLLLHAPKQRYQHTTGHRIPEPKNECEMLVKVEVVGLNPIDWKAP
jgi:hypothetical protein